MIVPPVFPCRSVFLFVPVSRSPYSPGLHQARPQIPVYIRSPSTSGFAFRLRFTCACQSRFASVLPSASRLHPVTIHFRFRFSSPFHVRLSLPVCISLTLNFPFTSGHHPLLIFLFASVSRVLVSPGLHQSHPQFPIYIRFTIHFRFLFSPTFHVRLSVPVFLLPPFFPFAVLPGALFPVPSFTFSTFLPSSVTSSMFRLINSSTSDSL